MTAPSKMMKPLQMFLVIVITLLWVVGLQGFLYLSNLRSQALAEVSTESQIRQNEIAVQELLPKIYWAQKAYRQASPTSEYAFTFADLGLGVDPLVLSNNKPNEMLYSGYTFTLVQSWEAQGIGKFLKAYRCHVKPMIQDQTGKNAWVLLHNGDLQKSLIRWEIVSNLSYTLPPQ